MVKSAAAIFSLMLILNGAQTLEASAHIVNPDSLLRDSVVVGVTEQDAIYATLKKRFPDCSVEVFVDESIELKNCLDYLPGDPLATVLGENGIVNEVVFKYEKPVNEKDDTLFKKWVKLINKRFGKPKEYSNPTFGDRRALWEAEHTAVLLFEPLNSMDGYVEVLTKEAYKTYQERLKNTMQPIEK